MILSSSTSPSNHQKHNPKTAARHHATTHSQPPATKTMPKPAASFASLLPQLWPRPLQPPPLLSRALSSPLLSSHLTLLRRRPLLNTTTLPASASAVVSTATAESPSTPYPVYDRLLPCPLQDDPPRIEHLVAMKDEIAADFISRSLSLPPLYVADLIKFGAVYYALVAPQPPPNASPEHFRIFKEVTEPSVLRQRVSIKGKTVREAQKTFRVMDPNQCLEAGTYLRVHVHPKRFPRCYEIDWKSRVIAVTDTYIVLDKPAATSVGGATDNIEESCATFTSRALGLETPLMTTHQIDNCSEGCVVLSKTKDFCSVFHGLIREKQVKKVYLGLTAAPVSMGILTHYMRPVNRAPRLVSEGHIGGWHLCQMEILECRKLPWPNSLIRKVYNVDNFGWPQQEAAYECKINLLTGKTHQIRAQVAAIGAPIIGDSAYMRAAMAAMATPSINPFGRGGKNYDSEEEKAAAIEAWIACHGKEPKSIIGLQASEISWDYEGEHYSYKAGVPWWRQDAVESDLI